MDTRAIHVDSNTEIGVISHNGKEFMAYGFVRTPENGTKLHLTAYLGKDQTVTKWDGTVIGKYHVSASWATPRSYVSSTMFQVVITLADGSVWTGRSAGVGMVVNAKPKK